MRPTRLSYLVLAFALPLLVACGAQSSPTSTSAPPSTMSSPTLEQTAEHTPTTAVSPPAADYPGLPLPTNRDELFAGSGVCAQCHTQLRDDGGADVSIDTAWRSSMMANAARDPYWQAAVREEVLSNPDYRAVIEDKCTTCHTPMARFSEAAAGGEGQLLDDGYVDPEHLSHALAMDGVSCTLCHQIQPDGLGEDESFTGGFVISTELPSDQRVAFGQFPVRMGMARMMQANSGFIPVQSLHIEQAEVCATCHTLYTPYLDASGQVAGEFPEQVPYLEWQASSFKEALTCQNCHMPTASGNAPIASVGAQIPRSPFYQHRFAGGNAYMLHVLETFGDQLAVTASSAQFQDKRELTLQQLQSHSASLALERLSLDGSTLTADVIVEINTGHKFPTGFPSRRVWIHITVQDGSGVTIFESGAANGLGSIADNDNDGDPAAFEPHHLVVDSPEQVQIYEAIMGDTEGQVTTTLLRGAEYLKDNRLLPEGFDKYAVEPDISVSGKALDDEDFLGGTDTVRYVVALNGAEGPFTVTAELLYQSIGFRWADNLRRHQAPELARFLDYYEQVPNRPVVVTSASTQLQ